MLFWDRAIAAGRAYGLVHQGLWFDVGTPAAIGWTEAILGRWLSAGRPASTPSLRTGRLPTRSPPG
jgi:NDP-sugar pyrophosphorylase family protein